VLEVRTRRRPYDLFVGNERVAEVALDETTIVVGSEHQPVRLQRVEIEAVPAWVTRLKPLVDTLQRECGLRPASLSKFEAGLLAAGVSIPGPPDLGPTALGTNPTVGDLAFAVLRRQFAVMLSNEPGTRLGQDPEALHDMRVATRRLRAALAQFAEALPVRAHHIRSELGWLADALGAVRDLDVQLERLDEWRAEVPEDDRGALGDLAGLLRRERDEAREHLLTALDSARYERLVAGFTTMLRQGPSRRSASARSPAITAIPDLVTARHRSAVKAARRARRSHDPDDFHRLRIRAKRLRYSLEFVSEIYVGQTAKYVRTVVKLQDALGLMQDARVAATRLHELATSSQSALSPTTIFAMGGVAERYRHEAQTLADKVPERLKKLRGPAWRRLIATMDQRRLEYGSLYRWPGQVAPAGAQPVAASAPASHVASTHPAGTPATRPAPPSDREARTPWVRDPVLPERPGAANDEAPATHAPRRSAHVPAPAPPRQETGPSTGEGVSPAAVSPGAVPPGASAHDGHGRGRGTVPHSTNGDGPRREDGS
jgi:CHAD domain-containing protein